MSEGNKLLALSVEVKNFKRSYDKTVQRHIESVTFVLKKKKKQELVFTREEKIDVNRQLMSGFKTKWIDQYI